MIAALISAYYAFPETLIDRVPEWVPPEAGLIVVHAARRGDYAREIRPARRKKALPLTDRQMHEMFRACYYRYWRQQMSILGARFARDFREAAR